MVFKHLRLRTVFFFFFPHSENRMNVLKGKNLETIMAK